MFFTQTQDVATTTGFADPTLMQSVHSSALTYRPGDLYLLHTMPDRSLLIASVNNVHESDGRGTIPVSEREDHPGISSCRRGLP